MQSMSVTKRPSAIITAVFAMVMTAASCRRDNDFNAETNLPQTVSNNISAGVATASPDIKRDSPVSPQGTYCHSETTRTRKSSLRETTFAVKSAIRMMPKSRRAFWICFLKWRWSITLTTRYYIPDRLDTDTCGMSQ